MQKIFFIALKDLQVILRDRSALILMLAAPYLLALGFGLVSGSFSGDDSGSGLARIPIVVVNEDRGELGAGFVDLLQGERFADLLAVTNGATPASARDAVDREAASAAIVLPAGFSAGLLPGADGSRPEAATPVEIYGSAARPISAQVVQSIVDGYLAELDRSVIATQVTIDQLLRNGIADPAALPVLIPAISARSEQSDAQALIAVAVSEQGAVVEETEFNLLSFFAPGMAILFLMYTVSLGGRTFLSERTAGTLPRMLVTPTATAQIIGGKMMGIFLTGLVQVGVLMISFVLMLGLNWGGPGPVVLLVLAVVFAATGWGALLAAFSRTPGQVQTFGTALMLLFGMMGGTFGGPDGIPGWLRPLSQLTPNYWGLRGFVDLGLGGALADITTPLIWLTAIGAVLFAVSTVAFRRQYA